MKDIEQKLRSLIRKQAHIQQQWDKTGQHRLLKFVVKFVPKLLDVESCSIFIHDPISERVWMTCGTDLPDGGVEVPKKGSLVGEVITTGRYQIRTGMDTETGIHTDIDSHTGFVTRNILCIPIKGITTKEATGAIQILNKRNDQEYTEEDRLILEETAHYIQMLVENVFLGEEIAALSEKVSTKVARADLILRVWAVFMALLILVVIFYVTPVLIKGF